MSDEAVKWWSDDMLGTKAKDRWGREWTLFDRKDYRTRDGRDMVLAVWEAPCMTCSGGMVRAEAPSLTRRVDRRKAFDTKRCPACIEERVPLPAETHKGESDDALRV